MSKKHFIALWSEGVDSMPMPEWEASLHEAEAKAYLRGLEDAAQIADEWVKYTTCPDHDDTPCCHVRTAASIAVKIREQIVHQLH